MTTADSPLTRHLLQAEATFTHHFQMFSRLAHHFEAINDFIIQSGEVIDLHWRGTGVRNPLLTSLDYSR